MKQFYSNTYSQNGEDGLIAEAIKRIKPKIKTAVEFGGADGFFCSNTALLRDNGWKVFMYDLQAYPPYVESKTITTENINDLPQCSVLSIDVDGEDVNLWLAYKGEPDIVIIEINSSLQPDVYSYSKSEGASFAAMNKAAESKGYFLLCHTGNCIYIHSKHLLLFPDADTTFNTSWL